MSLLLNNNIGYTIVGSPTISNNIASGFDSGNYLTISNSKLDLRNIVFHCKFKTGNNISAGQSIFQFGSTGAALPFLFWIQDNYFWVFYAGKANENKYTHANINLSTNTEYEAEFGTINSVRYFKFGTVGNMVDVPLTMGTDEDWNGSLTKDIWIGNAGPDLITAFTGSIDLNETYIKVNEVTWFNGKRNASTNINKVFYNNNVGYTIIGSPTIVDGIASGFVNGQNYLYTDADTFSVANFNNCEFFWRCSTGNSALPVFSIGSNQGLWIDILQSTKKLRVKIGDINYYDFDLPSSFNTNDYFNYKLVFNNYKCSFYFGSDDLTFISEHQFETPTNISYNNIIRIGSESWNWTGGTTWSGYIDLNETYIKINGITWFNGKEQTSIDVNYLVLNGGKTGYTVVGSPIINSGIMTNTSYEDYAKTSSALDLTSNSKLEFNIRFKTPETLEGGFRTLFSPDVWDSPIIMVTSSTNNYYLAGYAGDLYQISLNNNTYYRAKLVKSANSNIWTIYCYDDNGQLLGSTSGETVATQNKPILIGASYGSASPAIQAIDLNNTYIKVNDRYWFNGNSKLLWTDNNIYLQNLTGGGSGSDFGYIDAGFKPTNKTTFEFSFTKKDTSGSQINTSPFFVGGCTRDGITYNPFGVNFQGSAFSYFGYDFSMSYTAYNENKVYSTEISNGNYIYKENGVQISSTSVLPNQTTAENLYIGCWDYCYDSGNHIPYYPMLGNLKYIKFWEDGILIRHFVPVPANFIVGGGYETPSICMFDIVEQKFYPNLGTSSFTYGKD